MLPIIEQWRKISMYVPTLEHRHFWDQRTFDLVALSVKRTSFGVISSIILAPSMLRWTGQHTANRAELVCMTGGGAHAR